MDFSQHSSSSYYILKKPSSYIVAMQCDQDCFSGIKRMALAKGTKDFVTMVLQYGRGTLWLLLVDVPTLKSPFCA